MILILIWNHFKNDLPNTVRTEDSLNLRGWNLDF